MSTNEPIVFGDIATEPAPIAEVSETLTPYLGLILRSVELQKADPANDSTIGANVPTEAVTATKRKLNRAARSIGKSVTVVAIESGTEAAKSYTASSGRGVPAGQTRLLITAKERRVRRTATPDADLTPADAEAVANLVTAVAKSTPAKIAQVRAELAAKVTPAKVTPAKATPAKATAKKATK